MPVRVQCPNPDCQASFSVLEGDAPRFRRCPQCGWELEAGGEGKPGTPGSRGQSATDSRTAIIPPPPPEFAPGEVIDGQGYTIVKELGRGGMGTVFLARQVRLDRDVALKVPLVTDPEYLERFDREARLSARLNHDNICKVFDVGDHQGRPYLAMAYIEGITLKESIKQRKAPIDPETAGRVIRTLALAIQHAHERGIIHRDLKPSNVIIGREKGRPYVMDFGLAREGRSGLTRTGARLGTEEYMPMEQLLGDQKSIGPWSDVFSLGVIFFELLTGKRPFDDNPMAKTRPETTPAPSAAAPGPGAPSWTHFAQRRWPRM